MSKKKSNSRAKRKNPNCSAKHVKNNALRIPNDFIIDYVEDYLLNFLKSKLASKPYFGLKCDLSTDGLYTDIWVLAYDDRLIITEGSPDADSHEWKPISYAQYFYTEFTDIKAENYLATGAVTAKFNGYDKQLFQYTNSCMQKAIRFLKLIQKLQKGEPFTNGDYSQNAKKDRCPECGRLYPNRDRQFFPKCLKRSSILYRVLKYGVKYKLSLALILTCMLAMAVIGIVSPFINGVVLYDQTLTPGGRYYGKVFQVVMVMLGLSMLRHIIWIAQGQINVVLSGKIVYDLKLDIFTALQKLSLRFYNSKQTGSLMTRVNGDAISIQYFLSEGIPFFIINFVTLIVMTIIMLSLDWRLTLLIYIPVPFVIYIIKFVFPKFFRLKWRTFAKTSKLNSVMGDSFTAARVVKAFGKEQSEEMKFGSVNNELYMAQVRAGRQSAVTFPVLGWVMGLGSIFVYGFGGWQSAAGALTFGTFMTFLNFLGYVYGPINFMVRVFDWWTNCMTAAQRMFEIIDTRPEIVEKKNPVHLHHIKGGIALKNVTFSYEPNKPVLHNVSLNIKPGEMIGLVGHSGAGKSTITNLITRLYDVEEGEILIDGVRIKDISLRDLRPQIGMVLQDTFLFSGSIAENIGYSKPDASMNDIVTAAKLANAHEFIMKLPDGYETILGKRQLKLSGGEQQRISIARAILVNPRILILDEATASVDTETERNIKEALDRLIKGRTTIAIAHRLSTLRNADRIVVVEKGKIMEIGTHEELENKKGIYYKMLTVQRDALKIRGVDDD